MSRGVFLRTSPPPSYMTPTHEEMRRAAEAVGLRAYSPSLLADLSNVRAGGELLPPSAWRHEVERRVRAKALPPETAEEEIAEAVRYHTAVCDFLAGIDYWLKVPPGGSPLTQAAQLLKLLAAMPGGEETGEGALPIFQQAGDSIARNLASVLDEVETLDREEQELLDPEDDKSGTASGSLRNNNKMKIAEDLLRDQGKRAMLRIARNLEELSRMRVMREVRFRPDPEGDDVRNRPIRHLGELARVAKPAWALYQKNRPFFWYQAVRRQLPVRERGVRTERRQLLYIILDSSGSMEEGQRVAKACGVLLNRLKAVLRGDAIVYFRFFDTSLKEEQIASDAAEAKQAMEAVLRSGNYSGGGTDIGGCTKAALHRIEEIVAERELARPELVVVTDGDDTVSLQPQDLGSTRLHAFVVEGANPALTDLAVKTGGVGIDQL